MHMTVIMYSICGWVQTKSTHHWITVNKWQAKSKIRSERDEMNFIPRSTGDICVCRDNQSSATDACCETHGLAQAQTKPGNHMHIQ